MKHLGKIKLQDVTVLNDNEMKRVVGGSGDMGDGGSGGEKKCAYIQCYCTNGATFESGAEGSWRLPCGSNAINESGRINNSCIGKEGGCYEVTKEV